MEIPLLKRIKTRLALNNSPYARRFYYLSETVHLLAQVLPMRARQRLLPRLLWRMSPDRLLDQKLIASLQQYSEKALSPDEIQHFLHRYHQHVVRSLIDLPDVRQRDDQWLQKCVDVACDQQVIQSLSSADGTLMLTYHNHYKFIFSVVLGLLQARVNPMAMDHRMSEASQIPRLGAALHDFFEGVASFYNGGSFIYLTGSNHVAANRRCLRVLKSGDMLFSLNDTYSPQAGTRNSRLSFLKGDIPCPVGAIELALRNGARICVGWLEWSPDHKHYVFEVRQLQQGLSVDEVMSQYVGILQEQVRKDPAFWEGWKIL